jgi:DNA invertase Pin-like site-specific DNA recombinase
MSLTEIATAHHISRATVSRVIKEAREAASPKGCIPALPQTHENRLPNPAA